MSHLRHLAVSALVVTSACGAGPRAPAWVAPSAAHAPEAGASAAAPALTAPACPPMSASSAPPSGRPPRQVISQRMNDGVQALAVSPDGRFVAASSGARLVTVWSLRERALLRTLRIPELMSPIAVEWAAQGEQLVVGQTTSLLVDAGREQIVGRFAGTYKEATGSRLRRLTGHTGRPWLGLDGNDLALFDDQLTVAEKLRWPAGQSPLGAYVRGLAVASEGRVAAGAAGSKGVFLWDPARPEQPARAVPIVGDALTVALTPRGDLALVGVRAGAGSRIDVVDTSSGQVTGALAASTDAGSQGDWVTSLAVSPDGALAVAGSLHRVTMWDTKSRALRWSIESDAVLVRGRRDLQGMVQAVAFSPTEPVVIAGTARGDLVLLDVHTGRRLGELGVEVRRPARLLFDTRGRSLLALSGSHASRWSLDDARLDGAHLAPGIAAAAALPNGDFLVGRAPLSLSMRLPTDPPPPCANGATPIYLGRTSDPDGLAGLPGFTARALVLEEAAAKPVAAAGPLCVERGFGLVDVHPGARRALVDRRPDGLSVVSFDGALATPLRDSAGYLFTGALSPDGQRALASDLKTVAVWDAATGAPLARIPVPEGGGLGGDALAVFSPDGARVAVASGFVVATYALPAGRLLWRAQVTQPILAAAFSADGGEVFVGSALGGIGIVREGRVEGALDASASGGIGALAASPDGRLLASTSQDGGVRVWDLAKRAALATLVSFDDDEWMVATPGGAFAGTAEAEARIGWVFDAPLEHFGFEQFAARLRDPGLVKRRLARGEADVVAEVHRPPKLALAAPLVAATGAETVRLQVASGSRVDAVYAFREGRAVAAKAVCRAEADVSLEVPLLAGKNRLTFAAIDARGLASNPLSLDARGAEARRPDVWIVAVGVSSYPRLPARYQLQVADDDARSIAEVFSAQAGEGRAFARAHAVTLVDAEATAPAIRRALDGLGAMGPDDLAVVFLAGHGVKLDPAADMRFLTRAAKLERASVEADGLGWAEIGERLAAARGRVLLLLDACHSGHLSQELIVPNGALAATLSRQGRAGTVVFAAAKGRQESLEDGQHGFFTRALLETLKDATADRDRDGRLQLSELIESVEARVDGLTKGRQTPWVARREAFGDFVVAAASAR